MLDLQEIEARHRALGDIDRELFGLEDAVAGACLPGRDELVDDALGFAEHLEICFAVKLRHRSHARPADHHRLAPRPAQIDDFDRVEILRQHAAGHDQVGPFEIAVGQRLGVAVDQPNGPFRWQQRRDGDQAERRGRVFRAEEFAGRREIPKCFRTKAGVNHQDFTPRC